MRLDFLMLADGASLAEGKLYVHGGAITRINSPTLPFGPIPLAVVARFLLEDEDPGGETPMATIEWRRPDGSRLMPPGTAELSPDRPEGSLEGEEVGTVIVGNALVAFDTPGVHEVLFLVNGEPAASRHLLVVVPE